MIAYIAKRTGLIAMGYVAAMAVSAILVWASMMFFGASSFYVSQSPSVLPPEYASLVIALVGMLLWPLLPALILILAAEAFRWRRLWIYIIGWMLVFAVVAFSISLPFSDIGTTVANLSALLGGFVYWIIAGRHAGGPLKGVTA